VDGNGQHEPTAEKRPWPAWARPFLAALRRSGNVVQACRVADIDRTITYDLRARDAEFAAAWEKAKEDAVDWLEEVAYHRAEGGSDLLIIFLLKAARPDKYGDREALRRLKADLAQLKAHFGVGAP
jgi:hypothetical protein